MKKKIALLLAAVMTLSAVPTLGLFASSSNSITGGFVDLQTKALLINADGFTSGTTDKGGSIDVDYVTNAPIFVAKLGASSGDVVDAGEQFELTLTDNAEWFFAGGNIIDDIAGQQQTFLTSPTTKVTDTTPSTVKLLTVAVEAAKAAYDAIVDDVDIQADELAAVQLAFASVKTSANNITASQATANQAVADYKAAAIALADAVATATVSTLKALITGATGVDNLLTLADAAKTSTSATTGYYFDLSDSSKYKSVAKDNYTFYTQLNMYKDGLPYATIAVNDNSRQVAVVTMLVDVPKETEITIPVVARTTDAGGDITIRPYGTVLSNTSATINKVENNSGTNTTIASVKTGRDKVELDAITIRETSPGIIKEDGYTTLSIGDDFQWVIGGNFAITLGGGYVAGATTDYNAYLNADKNELTLRIGGLAKASGLRGTITITGLAVEPNEDAIDAGYYGQDVTMKIKEVDNYENGALSDPKVRNVLKSGVKEQSGIKIASFLDYGLKLSFDAGDNAKVVEANSGKKEIKAGIKGDDVAKIVLEELTTDSWWATRALDITLTDADGTVLDGVKFFSFDITDTDKITLTKGEVKAKGTVGEVKFDRSKVTVTSKTAIKAGDKAKMKFTILFNAAANFTGDVYVNVGGSGTKDTPDLRIKVATISAPIKVTTKSTNVAIGYQSYAVGDITVTENSAGALAKNKTVDFTVREFADVTSSSSTDVYFNPIKTDTLKVTSGDITFSKINLSNSRVISAEVGKESKTASTFTLSGLQVKIDRSAPFGTYDLVVGGDAWVETYDPDYSLLKKNEDDLAKFDIEGLVVKGYVDITTPPSSATISRNVVVVIGTNTAMVDGKEVDMGISTYIDPASNRTMLPLRAVAMLFGISDNNVNWDPATGKAVIIIGERIVTFTNGSSKMAINNIEFEMADENGVSVKAAINPENDRMYIPLRQLGIAYGVDVLWVDSTPGLAIFNPTPEQKEEAANASSAVAPEATTDEATTDETTTDETTTDETTTDEATA